MSRHTRQYRNRLNRLRQRDGARCAHCRRPENRPNRFGLTIDHIIPRSLGGSNAPWNLQLLCFDCNQSKGNRVEVDLFFHRVARA